MIQKFKQITSILLITFILASVNIIQAQTDKRIQFAKGKNSATVKGVFTKPNSGESYLLGVKARQKLTVNFEPDSGAAMPVVQVSTPGKNGKTVLDESFGEFEIDLETSGEYTIFVGCAKRCRYSLTVTIE